MFGAGSRGRAGVGEQKYSSVTADFKPLIFKYPTSFVGELNPSVRLEIITFINSFPIDTRTVSAMINKHLTEEEINEYNMHPIEVKVQSPKRTFIEKILIQKEIYLDTLNNSIEPETCRDRAS